VPVQILASSDSSRLRFGLWNSLRRFGAAVPASPALWRWEDSRFE